MAVPDMTRNESVTPFFRIGGWISLVACALLLVAQFIPSLAYTHAGPGARLLYPLTVGLYSVALIRGREAPGSHVLTGVAVVLMIVAVILMFAVSSPT
jgi:hypothetical protein